jgi:hypothetical protein
MEADCACFFPPYFCLHHTIRRYNNFFFSFFFWFSYVLYKHELIQSRAERKGSSLVQVLIARSQNSCKKISQLMSFIRRFVPNSPISWCSRCCSSYFNDWPLPIVCTAIPHVINGGTKTKKISIISRWFLPTTTTQLLNISIHIPYYTYPNLIVSHLFWPVSYM